MAFLDDTGVEEMAADIKTFADATYVPLSNMGVTTFTTTAEENITGSFAGLYLPALNLVIATFNFTVTADSASTTTNLLLLPERYRPSTTKYGSGYGKSSSATGGIRITVMPSGYIRQSTMSACTGGCGTIAYTLD